MADVQIAVIDQQNTQIALAAPSETQVNAAVPGVQGPAGEGVPQGGTANQVLFKQSGTDYDTAWGEVTSAMIGDLEIVDADVAANAEIAVSKLADGAARQLLQTDAAGTGVEWTNNVDVPGTLDVTSTATFDSIAQHPLGTAGAPTITFTGDNNTGIYSPGADQVALSTNGTGRLFVDASGNVGVGTSSPAQPLHVVGTIRTTTDFQLRDASNNRVLIIENVSNDARISNEVNGGNIIFRTNSGSNLERLRIDSSGRVGIGTSAPASIFHAAGTSAIGIFQSTSAGYNAQVNFQTSVGTWSVGQNINQTNTGALEFVKGSTRAVLDSSGRLGIGTTSAVDKLTVFGTDPAVSIYADSTTGRSDLFFRDSAGAQGRIRYTHTDDSLAFSTDAAERARIDGSGRLLVGTSSSRTDLSGPPLVQIEGANDSAKRYMSLTYGQAGVQGPYIFLAKHRSNTVGGSTIVQNNDQLGALSFYGHDGTDFEEGARIQAFVDGTPGVDDLPTRLVFSTTADGAASPTERLRITSAGLVGIGTSSPGSILHLSSSSSEYLRIQNTTAGNSVYLGNSSGTGVVQVDGANSFKVIINGNDRLIVDSSGRVGIGTTSPSSLLHLANDAGGGLGRILLDANVTSGYETKIEVTDVGLAFSAKSDARGFVFNTGSSLSEKIRITGGGSLLIGTSSIRNVGTSVAPASLLAEHSQSATSAAYIRNTNDASGAVVVLAKSRGTASGGTAIVVNNDSVGELRFAAADGVDIETQAASIKAEVDGTPDANDMPGRLVFATTADGSASPTERLRIDSSGRVGIGTQTPGLSGSNRTAVTINAPTSQLSILEFGVNNTLTGYLYSNASQTTLNSQNTPLTFDIGGERARIDSSGRLLIGTSTIIDNSNNKLHVEGTRAAILKGTGGAYQETFTVWNNATSGTIYQVVFRDGTAGELRGSITTNASSTSFNTSSDYRLKENVIAVTDGITRLQQLKPSRFNFIADPGKTVDGFLAHEVQDIVPEAISGEKDAVDDDGNPVYQGIDQSKLVPLLTAALQEAIGRIETLEAEVAALKG